MFYNSLPKLQSMVNSLPVPVSNTAYNLPVSGLQAPVLNMPYNLPTALQAPVSNCAQSCPPTFVPCATNSCHNHFNSYNSHYDIYHNPYCETFDYFC